MQEINYIQIDKYFANELTGEELLAFEKRLQQDNFFAEEVALYSDVDKTLSARFSNLQEENDLRNTLEDLGKVFIKDSFREKLTTTSKKKESKLINLKKYTKFLAAASIILFVSIVLFNNKKPSYADFAKHEQLDLLVRGSLNKHLIKAQKAFNTKRYVEAEKELKAVLNKDATKVELQLYLAISLIEQNKFDLADSILEKITNGNSIFKNKAIWYFGLSKLKQKEYHLCKEMLQKLPKDASDFEAAQKILKKL